MSKNVKLVYGKRFISRAGGINDVIVRNEVVTVTDNQAAYLLTLEEKDRSNNIHKKFVITDEVATKDDLSAMNERKRLAMAALADKKSDEEEESPAPKKKRAPRKPRAKKQPKATESAPADSGGEE